MYYMLRCENYIIHIVDTVFSTTTATTTATASETFTFEISELLFNDLTGGSHC
jgi:hypothetical protein